MSDGLEILWNILWALGGFFFGVAMLLAMLIFTEGIIRVKFFNIFRRGAYGMIKVMTDNQQIVTKIINKNKDKEVQVLDERFSIDKGKFLLEDGVSVIHYHYSNCLKTASWRPYDEIKMIFMVPTAVKVIANIPVPGDKKGEKPPIQQEIFLYGENMTPFQLPPQNTERTNEKGERIMEAISPPLWTKVDEKTIRYEAIAKPSEFASLVKANETEMEANAVLMRQKQLERLALFVMIAVGVSVFTFFVSILIAYWLNQTNGSISSVNGKMDAMNATITALRNQTASTVCGPIQIK